MGDVGLQEMKDLYDGQPEQDAVSDDVEDVERHIPALRFYCAGLEKLVISKLAP